MSNCSLNLMKPVEFFRGQVCQAADSLNLKLDDQVEFYLVNLLCDFIHPFQNEEDGELFEKPLAVLLKEALESSPGVQLKLLKKLGDTSLYIAGFFQDFFKKKTYPIGYYINMGSSAYQNVSNIFKLEHKDPSFYLMYDDLSNEFENLVDIVSEVAERSQSKGPLNQSKFDQESIEKYLIVKS